jgi:hypothetical protein
MPSKIEEVAATHREVSIEGYPCVVSIDKDGIQIRRKGDKRRNSNKPVVKVPWGQLLEIGAEKMGQNAYTYLGFDE